jgi:hypothetical protein
MPNENMAAAYLDNTLTRSEKSEVLKELMYAPASVLLTLNIAAAGIRAMKNANKSKRLRGKRDEKVKK